MINNRQTLALNDILEANRQTLVPSDILNDNRHTFTLSDILDANHHLPNPSCGSGNFLLSSSDILEANHRPNPDPKPHGLTAQLSIARQQLDNGDDREWAGTLRAAMESAFLDLAHKHHIPDTDIADIALHLDRTEDALRPGFYPAVATSIIALGNHQASGTLPWEWQHDIHAQAVIVLQQHSKLCHP